MENALGCEKYAFTAQRAKGLARQAGGKPVGKAERRKEKAAAARTPRRNNRKRDANSHARVLLQETSLPMEEICMLTGLDIYEVVGMKLKMRRDRLQGR